MTPTESFARARDLLFEHRSDPKAAKAEFRWPELEEFNFAWDWFDTLASGTQKDQDALVIVTDSASHPPAHAPQVDRVTYAELADRSKRVARYLQDAGVQKGDKLLLMLTNVVPLWETMLACIRLGVVIIPATAQLTPADIEDRLTRGGVKHFITDGVGATKLTDPSRVQVKLVTTGTADGFTSYADALEASPDPERVVTKATDPMLLYFTSGTTAKPKLVQHTHTSYPCGHLSTMYWIGIREGSVHQNISSPGWAKHAWSSVFAPWIAGATIFVHEQPRFSAKRTLDVLREHAIESLCAPPTVWRMLILESLGEKPAALKELVSAGEPLNPEVIDAVQKAWNITVRDGFGQTETTAQVGNSPGLTVKPGSMGVPLPGYDICLIDSANNVVREGEVAIRIAPSRPLGLMVGYQDDPARTAEVMAAGFYRTGDEARQDEDGYIHFVGRGDDVFKSSDYRISPFELESVLIEHELVAEAAIVPSPDALRLTVPKAFVVLKEGILEDAATARAIFAFCKEKLAPYKRIRRIEFGPLPKTISGKIRRVELRNRESALRATDNRAPKEFWIDDKE